MEKKRKTKITVETERLVIVRRREKDESGWCGRCEAKVRIITPEEAAVAAHVSTRTIYRWIEAERLHFTETPEGFLRICLDSLMSNLSQREN